MKFPFLLFTVTCITVAGCRQISQSVKDTLHPSVAADTIKKSGTANFSESDDDFSNDEEDKPRLTFIADTAALQRAEDALRSRPEFAGKKIMIYGSLHFYDNYRVLADIQNPENPSYADEYYYNNGKWDAPQPIRLSKDDAEDVSNNTVALDKLPFRNTYNLYKVLKAKYDSINAEAPDYSVYAVTYNGKIKWFPTSIANARSSYVISFNDDGMLKSFEQE